MSIEKTNAEKLKEKLFAQKDKGIKNLSAEEIIKADEFCGKYAEFLNLAKTEREAVEISLKTAKENGFEEYDRNKKYNAGDRVYCINRNKNILLAVFGKQPLEKGVRFSIAHIDSPRLDLKPNPLYESDEIASQGRLFRYRKNRR